MIDRDRRLALSNLVSDWFGTPRGSADAPVVASFQSDGTIRCDGCQQAIDRGRPVYPVHFNHPVAYSRHYCSHVCACTYRSGECQTSWQAFMERLGWSPWIEYRANGGGGIHWVLADASMEIVAHGGDEKWHQDLARARRMAGLTRFLVLIAEIRPTTPKLFRARAGIQAA